MLPRSLPFPFLRRLANLLAVHPFMWGGGGIESWAVRGEGETQGMFVGGGRHVEMELEEPAAHSTLWLEGTRVVWYMARAG